MDSVNAQFLLSMLIIALGYLSKRVGILSEKDGEGISSIVFNFTLPSVVITTFSNIKVDLSLGMLPLFSMGMGIFMAILAYFIFRKLPRQKRGTYSMLLPGFNVGLFSYPLVEGVWGEKGLQYFAMFDMGNSLIVFGLCYLIADWFSRDEGSVNFGTMFKRMAHSVPLWTYILTLVINLSGLHYPSIVLDIAEIIGRANMPLSLLLLGLYLSFSFEPSHWKDMLRILSIRYMTGALLGVVFFFLLSFDTYVRYTVLAGFLLPISMTVIPYSVRFNYNQKFVGTINNMTIVISFILMWLIFRTAPI